MSISDTSFLGTKMGKMHNILLNSLHPNLCGTVDLTQFKKKEGLLKKPQTFVWDRLKGKDAT